MVSKVFKKLFLNRLLEIEAENNIDLKGNFQQGFKKEKKSTTTARLTLQSIIANHVDTGEYRLMANLDLSAALTLLMIIYS